jgi:hypothetical protein
LTTPLESVILDTWQFLRPSIYQAPSLTTPQPFFASVYLTDLLCRAVEISRNRLKKARYLTASLYVALPFSQA